MQLQYLQQKLIITKCSAVYKLGEEATLHSEGDNLNTMKICFTKTSASIKCSFMKSITFCAHTPHTLIIQSVMP